jgi:shikimate kinase
MQTSHATFDDRDLSTIVLIGARGSGKSTVGRLLAGTLGIDFIDLDDRALALCGQPSISAVFERQGEAAWRQAEATALTAALRSTSVVLATGGGVACIEPAQSVLRGAAATGTFDIVWLQCDGQTLRSRLAKDIGDRPSLTGRDPVAETIDLAASRASAYKDISTHTVDASALPEQVAEHIRAILSPSV